MHALVEIYRKAKERGDAPNQAIAEHFSITIGAANARIYRARRSGLLNDDDSNDDDSTDESIEHDEHSSTDLTDEEKGYIREIFEDESHRHRVCTICGGLHLRACPRVKRIERHPDGTILAEEYWPPGTWENENIIFPETAYE